MYMQSTENIILVPDEFPEEYLNSIRNSGWIVKYLPGRSRQEYMQASKDCQVIMMNSAIHLDAEFLESAPKLQLVLRAGVGTDHIDEKMLELKGIRLVCTPGANAQAVGEMSLALLLNLLRNVRRADSEVRNFIWKREENRGTELSSLTVGIIGYGNTGKAFARVLSGFGCKILAYDKYIYKYGNEFVQEADPKKIQAEADVVSFHVPLTEETFHWGNTAFFQAFSKNIYVLNLARGAILDMTGLPALLDSGKIKGIGLDVLEQENFAKLNTDQKQLYQKLFDYPQILFTPHIGGWTFSSAENIRTYLWNALNNFKLNQSEKQ